MPDTCTKSMPDSLPRETNRNGLSAEDESGAAEGFGVRRGLIELGADGGGEAGPLAGVVEPLPEPQPARASSARIANAVGARPDGMGADMRISEEEAGPGPG